MTYQDKKCLQCHAVFTPISGRSKFCTKRCRMDATNSARRCDEEYRKKHRVEVAQYYRDNRDQVNARRRRNRRENPQIRVRERERRLKAYWSNREAMISKATQWQKENPHRVAMRNGRRKGREQGFPVSPRFQSRQIHRQRGVCYYCHIEMTAPGRTQDSSLQWDHVLPLSRGGVHSEGNLVAACRKCNLQKGSKFIMEIARLKGAL